MAKQYYYDSQGHEYCTHTDTGKLAFTTGESLEEAFHDAGDQTVTKANKFSKRSLGIGPMGSGRGNS